MVQRAGGTFRVSFQSESGSIKEEGVSASELDFFVMKWTGLTENVSPAPIDGLNHFFFHMCIHTVFQYNFYAKEGIAKAEHFTYIKFMLALW